MHANHPLILEAFNRPRAEALMQSAGLDALIATSPVNVKYLTGFHWWADSLMRHYMMHPGGTNELTENFALLTPGLAPRLVCNTIFAVTVVDSWACDLFSYGNPHPDLPSEQREKLSSDPLFLNIVGQEHAGTPIQAITVAVEQAGLAKTKLGLDMDWLSEGKIAAFKAAFPRAEIRNCSNLFRLIRMVKSAEEIERLRRSAEINEAAWKTAFSNRNTGDDLHDILKTFRTTLAQRGADMDHFAFTPNGLGMSTEGHCILPASGMMYIDAGCLYKQYFSDTAFTVTTGSPAGTFRTTYDILLECIGAGESKLLPGNKASEPRLTMQALLDRHAVTGAFPHGHGLGLEIRDYPIIMEPTHLKIRDDCINVDSDLPFEPGMVVNLEVASFQPGIGSVGLEKTWLLTETGAEPLIPQDRAEPFRLDA